MADGCRGRDSNERGFCTSLQLGDRATTWERGEFGDAIMSDGDTGDSAAQGRRYAVVFSSD